MLEMSYGRFAAALIVGGPRTEATKARAGTDEAHGISGSTEELAIGGRLSACLGITGTD